jgi:hypothetical protein
MIGVRAEMKMKIKIKIKTKLTLSFCLQFFLILSDGSIQTFIFGVGVKCFRNCAIAAMKKL